MVLHRQFSKACTLYADLDRESAIHNKFMTELLRTRNSVYLYGSHSIV